MDLHTRKLNVIRYLINFQDEKVFSKIEATIDLVRNQKDSRLKPITEKQLIDLANRSNQDYLSGRFKSQEQLESES